MLSRSIAIFTELCSRIFALPAIRALALGAALTACLSSANAQLDGKPAPKPLGVLFARNMSQESVLEYVNSLSEQLQHGELVRKSMESSRAEESTPEVDQQVIGMAMFLTQGLIPTFESVSFQQVADEADARRILEPQVRGDGGNIETKGNGCYRLVRTNSWTNDIPEGKDPDEYVKEVNSRYQNNSRNMKRSAELVEENGKTRVKQRWMWSYYYRYQDSLLFSSDFEELWTMELPTRESLTSGVGGENDVGVEANFDRIPQAYKTLGWNMLNSMAGVQMQQRDGESAVTSDVRRTAIQFGLNIVRMLMFDVQDAEAWIRWASSQDYTVRAAIDFRTRRNSGLTEHLEELSSGNSRFAPILRDEAPGTLHLCLRLFDAEDPMVQATGRWIAQQISDVANRDPEAVRAGQEIERTLVSISEHQTLELLVKAGYSEESQGVIYGGIQVDDNPYLLKSVYTLMQMPSKGVPVELNLTERDGYPVIHVHLPEKMTEEIAGMSGLNLSDLHVTHRDNCLWFAAGNENSYLLLRQAIEQCESRGSAARTPLMSLRVDLEQWLSLPQDEPVGVAALPLWLDANVDEFPPNPLPRPRISQGSPTPLLQRVLDLGGDRSFNFQVIADRGGVRGTLHLGKAIANYYVARMIDGSERMMKYSQEQREQRLRAQQQAKEQEAKAAEETTE